MNEIADLKRQIEGMNETVNQAHQFHNKVSYLHEEGLIREDLDGSLIVVDNPDERRQLKEEISSKKKPAEVISSINRRQAQNFGEQMDMNLQMDEDSTVFENIGPHIGQSSLVGN